METCDDCGQQYPEPAYYTFVGCHEEGPNGEVRDHVGCTENLCPNCTGPFIEPDLENDPRKPPVDFYDPKLHANLEEQYP